MYNIWNLKYYQILKLDRVFCLYFHTFCWMCCSILPEQWILWSKWAISTHLLIISLSLSYVIFSTFCIEKMMKSPLYVCICLFGNIWRIFVNQPAKNHRFNHLFLNKIQTNICMYIINNIYRPKNPFELHGSRPFTSYFLSIPFLK